MKLSQKAKNAVLIGTLCSFSYFAVYIARNILSAVTPQMVDGGYSEEYIGSISAVYFIFYAVGQLINGMIGDKIKAKWMISVGLFGAGVTNLLFLRTTVYQGLSVFVYGLTGFLLSMIYGPMTRVVAENTEPNHAMRCSLGYTFASFFGTPVAGLLATFLVWQSVFAVGSGALMVMALVVFSFFTAFERRGIVRYGTCNKKEKGTGNIAVLFKHDIVKFSLISILTGVVRTSVVFWLPTYIAQYLGFSAKHSASVFTGASLVISLAAFVAVFAYERLGNDMNKTILIMFSLAAVFFAMTYFVTQPVVNIVALVLAILASDAASAIMWSRYCPGLRDTGMVSSVTGYLDFLSYMAAAAANYIFAGAVTSIGWGNLILVWLGLMVFGTLISLPYGKIRARLARK